MFLNPLACTGIEHHSGSAQRSRTSDRPYDPGSGHILSTCRSDCVYPDGSVLAPAAASAS